MTVTGAVRDVMRWRGARGAEACARRRLQCVADVAAMVVAGRRLRARDGVQRVAAEEGTRRLDSFE